MIIILLSLNGFCQNSSASDTLCNKDFTIIIDENRFDESLFSSALLCAINIELVNQNLSTLFPNKILSDASSDYAQYLVKIDDSKPELGGKKQSLSYRLKKYGGAANYCIEICLKNNIRKGKERQTYKDLANDFVFKWFNSKQTDDIKNPQYVLFGTACKLDETKKKIYVSLILGNYHTINTNSLAIKNSGLNISTKSQGLKPYDSKVCKNCDRYKSIDTLQRCLSVEGNNIFLDADQKLVKKILKNPNDGFAVDIVLRKQFPCNGENIIDKILPSKGYMTKKINQTKLLKMNLYKGKLAKTKFKVLLGQIPAGLSDYELNLIVIQDKYFCKNIRHAYTELNQISTNSKLKIIGDTITFFNDFNYTPTPDTTFLTFKIPFDLGKSDYNSEDIKPLIEALNEPDFIITSLKITAYSSIEGTEEKNEQLRIARAQNIVKAFQQLQRGNHIDAEIVNSDSWKLFLADIRNTEWDSLKNKSIDQIRDIIQKNKLEPKLEPILSRHRFGKIEMKVIYDLGSVQKEQGYVLKKFHQALDSSNIVKALSIQKYIIKKVRRGIYSKYIIPQMQIPRDSARFAGMQMNQLWLDYIINNKPVDSLFYTEVCRLQKLDTKNEYIIFNKLFCEINLFDLTDEATVGSMLQKVDALRTSKLRKSDVDPLNIEFQVKIIQSIGNTLKVADEQKTTLDALNRLKSIIDLQSGDWKNALKLSILFIQTGDFEYPISLLEPYVIKKDVDPKLLFTYLSACTHIDYKPFTGVFEYALKKAFTIDKTRTCKLFSNGDMSFQLFENPNVKAMVCEQCGL